MVPTLFVKLVLAAMVAQPPVPRPPIPTAKESVRITSLENAVITLSGDKDGVVKFEPVKTSDGPRIRVTFAGVTLEATRLQVRRGNDITTLSAGKDGLMEANGERVPDMGSSPKPPVKQAKP
jgi:hypothetical protein